MSKGGFNLALPLIKVSWAWLKQSGDAENFYFNPIALNLFPLVKHLKRVFPITGRYNPELGLADQWEYDS